MAETLPRHDLLLLPWSKAVAPDNLIQWTDPWHPVGTGEQGLAAELEREVGPRHPLAGVRAVPVARRHDQDDVLFLLPEDGNRLALVHLTWSGKREADPQWPHTLFYQDWEDWKARGMGAHDDQ